MVHVRGGGFPSAIPARVSEIEMKDVQGIQRGKCNALGCECEEYRTSSDGQSSSASGKFRCEYCDHTPVQHVKIIELGECRQCGKDNCEKYEFEDPNSYQNCAYCDCPASAHAGAEKLRKPTPQQQQQQQPQMSMFQGGVPVSAMPVPGVHGMAVVSQQGGFQPRRDQSGQPTQSNQFGTCKFPGCGFPKRIEGSKVHDFCSRTCAKKYSQLPPQAMMSSAPTGGQMMPGHHAAYGQVGGGGQQPTAHVVRGTGPGPATSTMAASYQSVTVLSQGQTMCKKCQKQPANPGYPWCQGCFSSKS